MTTTEMPYRRLGNSGLKVSVFGLGGWTTFGGSVKDDGAVRGIIGRAKDAGINFFDIADVYATGAAEEVMGRAFKDYPRHELVITSKVFWPMSEDVNDRGLSRKHVMESVERSLRRIGTDYLDIYFCHRFDPETPVEETVRAMDDLVHQGKVLYWGTSEWTGEQLRDACRLADARNLHRPQVEQPQYSLLERRKFEGDVRPAAVELGMGLVVWSPLASGVLTGKYDESVPPGSRLDRVGWLREAVGGEDNVGRVRRMKSLVDDGRFSRAQLALAWAAAQPGVSSVLLGATSVDQLEENLGALRVDVTREVSERLDSLFPGGRA